METEQHWAHISENEANTDAAISEDGTVKPLSVATFVATSPDKFTETYRRIALYESLHPKNPARRRMYDLYCTENDMKHYCLFGL